MRYKWRPIMVIASSIAAGVAMTTSAGSPTRALISFWFLMICPGMAFVPLLKIDPLVIEWTMAIALSIALDTGMALMMLYAGVWSFRWGLIILIVLSLAGAVTQLVTVGRVPADTTRQAERSELQANEGKT